MLHPFFSEFTDPKFEKEFQEFRLKQLNKILIAGLSLFFINSILLIFYDLNYAFGNLVDGRLFTFYARILYAIYVGASIIIILNSKNSNKSQMLILIFFIFTSIITILIQQIRPLNYSTSFVIEVLVSLSFYLVFPIRLKFQMIGGVLYSLMNMYTLFVGDFPESRQIMTTGLFITTNTFGFIVSKYYHKDKRVIFQLFLKEHELNHKLEGALHDVKTLSGIIPICASCKKIRDDQGYWNQLEEFISNNSHAKFTHSICEDCRDKMLKEGLEDDA